MNAPAVASFSKGYRVWLIVILLAINTFNFADRAVLSALAEAVKRDLAISDFQLGLLQGFGFAVFYAIMGLPIARLAEKRNRAGIIAVAAGLWSVFAALCGAAGNFMQFLLCRVGVGVGEAGFNPPVASLVGDHWPAARRSSIMALIGLGGAAGPLLGALGGGWIADHYGWRTAFVVIASPGILLGIVAWATIKDPPRGLADGVQADSAPVPGIWLTFRTLLAKPAFRHTLAGAAIGSAATNGMSQFLGVYFVRAFDLTFTQAGALFGAVSAIAVTSGLLVGGFGADWLGKRDLRWIAWACAIGLAACSPLFLIAYFQTNALMMTLFFGIGSALLFIYYGPALAMIQNLSPPRMRASASFIGAFVAGIVGLGLGPAIIGAISDFAAGQAFGPGYAAMCSGAGTDPACKAAQISGLRDALIVDSLIFVWAGLHYYLASRTFRQDIYRAAEQH